jgi:anti-sigma factor RsiW
MKKCPSQQQIAAFGAAGLPPKEAAAVAKHLTRCQKCRRTAEQSERLQILLRHIKPSAGGSFHFSPPVLSAGALQHLKESTVAEFKQRERWRRTVKAIVQELWGQVVGKSPDLEVAPPPFGYAATRPRKRSKPKRSGRPRLVAELQASLADLFEVLLDPSVPLEQRVTWAKQIKANLGQMAAAPPAQRSGGKQA